MRLMFSVFIASFFALLWAAFSIARHIRRQERARSEAQEATVQPAQPEKIRVAGRR